MVRLLSLLLAVLVAGPFDAFAQSVVIVLPSAEPADVAASEQLVALLRAQGEETTLHRLDALSAPGAAEPLAAFVEGETAFYEGASDEAQRSLELGLAALRAAPVLLHSDAPLREACQRGLVLLMRLHLARADFDAAAALARELVELFPAWSLPRQETPPEVVELVEQSRARMLAQARRLLLDAQDDCALLLNGEPIEVPQAQALSLGLRSYVMALRCGEATSLPLLLSLQRADSPLTLSTALRELLSESPGAALDVPRVSSALATLSGADHGYLYLSGEESCTLTEWSFEAWRQVACTEPSPALGELLAGLQSLPFAEPGTDSGAVAGDALDTGVVVAGVGMGVSALLLGGSLVAALVATSYADELESCTPQRGCSASEAEASAQHYTDSLFASHLLALGGGVGLAASGTALLVLLLGDESVAVHEADRPMQVGWAWRW